MNSPTPETPEIPAFRSFAVADIPLLDAYRLLTQCVAPRPIALVSTQSEEGLPNLAPFSFFMAGGANPPSVAVSPTTSRDGAKDTLRNIRETGEFTISVVTYEIHERVNQASAEYPYGVSEWEPARLTPTPSVLVRPARVQESPLSMECRLYQIVPHGNGPSSANYIIGEVVYFHIAESVLNESGSVDTTQVDYVSRLGGDWYSRADARSLFTLPRPR